MVFKKIVIYIAIFVCINPNYSTAQKDTLNVLFVGNSFTYFWNVPQVVSAMAESQSQVINAKQSTIGGSNWEQHWKEERGLNTKEIIQEGQWDYVVLQNHSASTFKRAAQFREYGHKFAELIRSAGAKPILYMTWAYKSDPTIQNSITKGYQSLANELDIEFVPVGPIWETVRNNSSLDLYFDDKHQSHIGAYLIGLAFTKHFTGLVDQVPDRLITTDKDGEKLYLSFMLKDDGEYLRQTVGGFDFEKYLQSIE